MAGCRGGDAKCCIGLFVPADVAGCSRVLFFLSVATKPTQARVRGRLRGRGGRKVGLSVACSWVCM